MATEENKAVVRRLLETVDRDKGTQGLSDLIASPFETNFTGMPGPLTAESFSPLVTSFYTAFPDLRHEILELVAEGDRVAGRVEITGTHHGEMMGVAPTGKRISVHSFGLWRIVDGRVKEQWVQPDMMGLMQQIGAIPAAPAVPQPVC